MYRFIIKLFIIPVLSIIACGDQDNDNHWNSKDSLGESVPAIDISNTLPLMQDSQVDEVYKKTMPKLCKNYVLWQVMHNGSCWVSSAIAQFLFQLIESGPKKFDNIIAQMKSMLIKDNDNKKFKEFFDFFELIKREMDYKHALAIFGHRNVYEVLNRGFRALLAQYLRANKKYEAMAKEIEKPSSWGNASEFGPLFRNLGLKYAGLKTDGKYGKTKATKVEAPDLADYFGSAQYSDLSAIDSLFETNKEQRPKIIYFRSSPGYMNIAVLKGYF